MKYNWRQINDINTYWGSMELKKSFISQLGVGTDLVKTDYAKRLKYRNINPFTGFSFNKQ